MTRSKIRLYVVLIVLLFLIPPIQLTKQWLKHTETDRAVVKGLEQTDSLLGAKSITTWTAILISFGHFFLL